MNVLAWDMAERSAPALVLYAQGRIWSRSWPATRPPSEELEAMVRALTQAAGVRLSEISALVVGVGPGSFTGIRIACAFASGLALALDVPVHPISSLAITAAQTGTNGPVLAVADARAGLAYRGVWQGLRCVEEDRCVPIEETPDRPFAALSAPAAWAHLPRLAIARPRTEALASLIPQALAEVPPVRFPRPRYLQPSQAERDAA
ncbi:MAG: tRNA (adenosine(37)-N6)-threonylcarbamoyltransferase complex dimerization subunit type 1 TsaB [Zetaproteobacteria bacterium]|nr:MAG: tRNA (adenosine(37)-N6)-threonylcarbamoyltransferase complex dimerization subunit type 1 TsaB [Zetaproteobacteria bacterium]